MASGHAATGASCTMTAANDLGSCARARALRVGVILRRMPTVQARGPLVTKAQPHLTGWVLPPICKQIGQEAFDQVGGDLVIDVGRLPQALDAGGRGRWRSCSRRWGGATGSVWHRTHSIAR